MKTGRLLDSNGTPAELWPISSLGSRDINILVSLENCVHAGRFGVTNVGSCWLLCDTKECSRLPICSRQNGCETLSIDIHINRLPLNDRNTSRVIDRFLLGLKRNASRVKLKARKRMDRVDYINCS